MCASDKFRMDGISSEVEPFDFQFPRDPRWRIVDDVTVPPYASICVIEARRARNDRVRMTRGTGWLIAYKGFSAIVTAAHVVQHFEFDGTPPIAAIAVVRFGPETGSEQTITIDREQIFVHSRFRTGDSSSPFDVALLRLSRALEGIEPLQVDSRVLSGEVEMKLEVAGYPWAPEPSERAEFGIDGATMYAHSGQLAVNDRTELLEHRIDTFNSQSGSPLLEEFDGRQKREVRFMHTRGHLSSVRRNLAIRVSTEKLNDVSRTWPIRGIA